ncbi:hypothetical protein V8C86DRAFT_2810652 [Haematococcus lacustris]
MRLPSQTPFSPSGPYDVGARDISFATGDTLEPTKHLCGRLFYPAPPNSRTWSTPIAWWLPHLNYAYGYANYAFFWARGKGLKYWAMQAITQALVQALGTLFELPVVYNAPLATPARGVEGKGQPAGPAGACMETASATTVAAGNNPLGLPQQQAQHGTDTGRYPVVIFSHGLAGNRNTYSCICTELASQGCVVLAIEHADGTASTARLARRYPSSPSAPTDPAAKSAELGAGKAGAQAAGGQELPTGIRGAWRYYAGLGSWQASVTTAKTEWRAQEVDTAIRLLQDLNAGVARPGLRLSGIRTRPPGPQLLASFLKGRLDLSQLLLVGHSWGGATVALAASRLPEVAAAVALDPWWDALPLESPALKGWATSAPLLVLGSHTWNSPNAQGNLPCGRHQDTVLQAAAQGQGAGAELGRGWAAEEPALGGKGRGKGPGALLLVPKDSSHNSFDDISLYFGGIAAPLFKMFPPQFRFQNKLPQAMALDITCSCILNLLHRQLGCQLPVPGTCQDASTSQALPSRDLGSPTSGSERHTSQATQPGDGGSHTDDVTARKASAARLPATLPVTERMTRAWAAARLSSKPMGNKLGAGRVPRGFGPGDVDSYTSVWPEGTFEIVRLAD